MSLPTDATTGAHAADEHSDTDSPSPPVELGPPGVSSAKATILCVRAGPEAVAPGREGAGLAC